MRVLTSTVRFSVCLNLSVQILALDKATKDDVLIGVLPFFHIVACCIVT